MAQLSLIGSLMPLKAAFHECPFPSDRPQLHAVEEHYLLNSSMSDKRKREFALGRWCAHQAIASFNRTEEPLLSGPTRAPIWPSGLIGSITHCEQYCAAVVASTADFIAVGIDAEQWREVSLDILPYIATEYEYELSLLDKLDIRNLALIFSAKESIFKALNPITNVYFDFLSVVLAVDFSSNQFFIYSSNIPIVASYRSRLFGKFVFSNDHVLTAAFIAR